MSWTAPRTWVTGEIVTASLMNTHVRDNMLETAAAKAAAAGDIFYATAANALTKLSIGTNGQFLGVNSGGTAPEWQEISTANGNFNDTTTSIGAGADLTKTISTGVTAKHGIIQLQNVAAGTVVVFTDTNTESIGLNADSSSGYVYSRSVDSRLSKNGQFGTLIYLKEVYMDGQDLKVVFTNADASSQTIALSNATWQVPT